MATTYPPKVLDLTFRASIEGSHYSRPTEYVGFEPPAEFRKQMQEFSDVGYHTLGDIDAVATADVLRSLGCEWVVVQRNYQKYPSGGESYYASYAYWNGSRLETAQGNGRIHWLDVRFYRVVRSEAEQQMPSTEQQEAALKNLEHWIQVLGGSHFVDRVVEMRQILSAMRANTAAKEQWWYWLYR